MAQEPQLSSLKFGRSVLPRRNTAACVVVFATSMIPCRSSTSSQTARVEMVYFSWVGDAGRVSLADIREEAGRARSLQDQDLVVAGLGMSATASALRA